jgi:beta-N-acetylhexosaminidase
MIDTMRQELAFDGLLMTDDLSMEALPGTIPTRAMAAQRAGIDIVLHCNGNAGEMQSVAEVLERPTPKTRQRMQAAIEVRDALVPQSLDIDALHAQLGA